MPIRYNISPELNIILYIGEGLITGTEFFKAAELAKYDERRKWGMITIIDIFSAEADFDLEDMHFVINFTNNLSQKGLEPEQVIVLSHSKGIRLIGDTIKLMSNKAPVKVDVFSTLDDLVSSLFISESKQEFIQFYNDSKTKNESAKLISHSDKK